MIKQIYQNKKTLLSFEVFPPKKADDFPAVYSTLDELKTLSPDFISVTFGAGGSNSKKTAEIASYIQNECQIEALLHMTCVGYKRSDLEEALLLLKNSGLHNLLALRGDRPQLMTDEQYEGRDFLYANDMIAFLRTHYSEELCIGAACYPEKHFEAETIDADLRMLYQKVNAGADFLITQMFFDNNLFYSFREKVEKMGISLPISTGIMPITNANQLGRSVSLSGSSVPKKLTDIIAKYGESPVDMRKAGIEYAVGQIKDLKNNGVDGIHLYTMNKAATAKEILSML
ncbi:MAG: methylenetetrahydrofolate reductase [NAD(P)H] [Lachnospiraceae bacterium]